MSLPKFLVQQNTPPPLPVRPPRAPKAPARGGRLATWSEDQQERLNAAFARGDRVAVTNLMKENL